MPEFAASGDVWLKKTGFVTAKPVTIVKFLERKEGLYGEECVFEVMEDDGVYGNLSLWTKSREIKFLTHKFLSQPEQWMGKRIFLRAVPVTTQAGKASLAWNVGV